MYYKVLIIIGIVGIIGACFSLILGLLSIIPFAVVTVLVTICLGIPSLVLAYGKLKPEVSVKPSTEEAEQERKKISLPRLVAETVKEEKEIPARRETIVVSPTESYYYEFELSRGDRVKGEISSTSRLDIYFLDETNFDRWDRDRSFYPEECNEGILEADIDYEASRNGTWYVTIDNNGRKSAKVKINLSIIEASLFGIE